MSIGGVTVVEHLETSNSKLEFHKMATTLGAHKRPVEISIWKRNTSPGPRVTRTYFGMGGGHKQGGIKFEIFWEPNFPVDNFARNNGKNRIIIKTIINIKL